MNRPLPHRGRPRVSPRDGPDGFTNSGPSYPHPLTRFARQARYRLPARSLGPFPAKALFGPDGARARRRSPSGSAALPRRRRFDSGYFYRPHPLEKVGSFGSRNRRLGVWPRRRTAAAGNRKIGCFLCACTPSPKSSGPPNRPGVRSPATTKNRTSGRFHCPDWGSEVTGRIEIKGFLSRCGKSTPTPMAASPRPLRLEF